MHDEKAAHSGLAFFLSQLENPDFPVPLGVFRAVDAPTYEATEQGDGARTPVAAKGPGDLARLLNGGDTWTIA